MAADGDEYLNGLNVIWRTCRKYQSALSRYNIKLREQFCEYDPQGIGLIQKSLFTAILANYQDEVGLSTHEINEVTDYFQLRDGRVAYGEFCKLIREKPAPNDDPYSLGAELNDPMHVNIIAHPEERRRLFILLAKIARINHLPLEPYFQDYLYISKSFGLVTLPHFRRVLTFMKIPLNNDEYILLSKRYLKDSYLFNYAAFITHIQNIQKYLKDEGLLNTNNAIINFPGKLVDLDLPELPTFDSDKILPNVFADTCNHKKEKDICHVIIFLQKNIFERRIRVREFLEPFDLLRTGNITMNQFERGIHSMGIGNLITQPEFRKLCERYKDPVDSSRIRWLEFEDEMDEAFTIKNLDKNPLIEVESPPKYLTEMPREGEMNWSEASPAVRDHCEEALRRVQVIIQNRRIHMHPMFRTYDKLRSGHVNCKQFIQILVTNGVLLSRDEINALKDRYGNELGFNYGEFLYDADPAIYAVPQLTSRPKLTCAQNAEDELDFEGEKDPNNRDYIVYILSKAKRIVTTNSIPLINFLQDFDRHREGEILEVDFRRALDNANVKMLPKEVDVICNSFRSVKRSCSVAYRNFMKALEEVFILIESPNSNADPLPIKHFANLDCHDCNLNFEERTLCSHALMKYARYADNISNLSAVLKDFDHPNIGVISRNQLLRGLTIRDMHHLASGREFDAVCKCFGVQRGTTFDFNYRAFMNILNTLHETGQIKRHY
ncbi:uncharacterized protein LOC119683610 [Teleopsis dalmanni]|uniref:uncharacterized protein LOC119683610 n=1 Tax=Teleopsis dalmanni TaxID=139649 RepID=UPI0018CEA101|nr:uncharacterized protein LOC119683610 [Teleopsis dalmanni]